MLVAYSRHVIMLTRAYFLALLITILSKINLGLTMFSYHPPAMVAGAWIFYEAAVFKKSRLRIDLYLKNTIHGFIALVALAAACFGYWVSVLLETKIITCCFSILMLKTDLSVSLNILLLPAAGIRIFL